MKILNWLFSPLNPRFSPVNNILMLLDSYVKGNKHFTLFLLSIKIYGSHKLSQICKNIHGKKYSHYNHKIRGILF